MTGNRIRISLALGVPTVDPSRMKQPLSSTVSLVVPFLALSACEDRQLPDLTVSMGGNTTLGTDLRAEDPVLGITVIDPLGRLPG